MATPTIVGTRRVQSGGESTGAYPSLFARMVDRLSGSFWVKLLLSMLELLWRTPTQEVLCKPEQRL